MDELHAKENDFRKYSFFKKTFNFNSLFDFFIKLTNVRNSDQSSQRFHESILL